MISRLLRASSLLPLCGLLVSSSASAQIVLGAGSGSNAGDAFGAAVAGAGDVDGDGYDDWIVGTQGDDDNGSNSGSASVFSGFDGALLYHWNGEDPDDWFGYAVAGAGDVDGDGYDDLIVGTPNDAEFGTESGSARVFSGFDGSILYTLLGSNAHDELGRSVNGAGDVNGDGFDDFVIGVPGDNAAFPGGGSARVYSGMNGALLYTFLGQELQETLGYSVDGAGDVNGDGFDDIVAGAIGTDANGTNSGSVRVYSGQNGSVLHTFPGTVAFEQFGHSVAGAGDANADGYDDVIAGAPSADNTFGNAGTVRVYSGLDGSILHLLDGTMERDYFGFAVAGAGDVNADGHDDFVVGAPVQSTPGPDLGPGSVRVYSGDTGTLLFEVEGDDLGDKLGSSVGGAIDVNADGFFDVVCGAPSDDDNGSGSGSALAVTLDRSTWWVSASAPAGGDGSVGAPFQTIQEGVDAAGDGERVAVLAGIYYENLRIWSGDILVEAVEPGAVIDGGDLAMAVDFRSFDYGQGSNQGLKGFTVRNGNSETWGIGGGGVTISLCSPTIEDCVIEDCHGDFGGGLYAGGGTPIVRNVTIRDCYAKPSFDFSRGGGLMFSHCPGALIEDCTIEDNSCENEFAGGGGVYFQFCDGLVLRNTSILRNSTGDEGGGIFVRESTISVEACDVRDNTASVGGGAYFHQAGSTLERTLVVGNTAAAGAGVYRGALVHSVVYGNVGVGVENSTSVVNSIIRENSAGSLVNTSNVTYSNVAGIPLTSGNLDAPANFWAPTGGGVGASDFHLQPSSPCIDSGDPNSPTDPDGSRADMGVYPFDSGHEPAPVIYCVSHADSQGCIAEVETTGGAASLSGNQALGIQATQVRAQATGLMFWGYGPSSAPVLGETLCVAPQLVRGNVSNSGGTAPCGGGFTRTFSSTEIAAGGLSVGDSVYAQFWYRDPSDITYGSAFSNAVWFVVVP